MKTLSPSSYKGVSAEEADGWMDNKLVKSDCVDRCLVALYM